MEMPTWFQDDLRMAWEMKDVYLIVQLNKSWFKTLKELDKNKE